jgi:hypothetical protein
MLITLVRGLSQFPCCDDNYKRRNCQAGQSHQAGYLRCMEEGLLITKRQT